MKETKKHVSSLLLFRPFVCKNFVNYDMKTTKLSRVMENRQFDEAILFEPAAMSLD